MAANANANKNTIPVPDEPRSRPSTWLQQTKGNVRMAAVLFACAEHVWLTYHGGRTYLAECRLAGIQPDDFGWTAEDTRAERQFAFVDFNWTDPVVQKYLNEFLALVPEATLLRVKRGTR